MGANLIPPAASGGGVTVIGGDGDPLIFDGQDWQHGIYVGNTSQAQQTSAGMGNAESGTAANGGPAANEPYYRQFTSAASIGATYGWQSGPIFTTDQPIIAFINGTPITSFANTRIWVGLYAQTIGNMAFDAPNVHIAAFRASDNVPDTNWKAVTCGGTGASSTLTDTGVAVALATYKTFGVIFQPGVSAEFYINGVLVATHTTNLPAAAQNMRLSYAGITITAVARVCRVPWATCKHRLQQ